MNKLFKNCNKQIKNCNKYNFKYTNNITSKLFCNQYIENTLKKLNNTLSQQVNNSLRDYYPIPKEEVDLFLSTSGFKFEEKENSKILELSKHYLDYKVSVYFCAKEISVEKKRNSLVDVIILLRKKNKENIGYFIDGYASEGNMNYNSFLYTEDLEKFKEEYLMGQISTKHYQPPNFDSLDETVQARFINLMKDIGLTKDCVNFIEVTSLDKEQKLYQNWLSNIKNELI